MKKYVEDTLKYYNEHTREFIDKTKDADMTYLYNVFEKYIDAGGAILDLGCGTGRDAKHFIDEGYEVTAIDGSEELCRYASEYTGQPVACQLFSELDYYQHFDGIWASASLLHIAKGELPDIIRRIYDALKPGGYLYAGLKHGTFEGMRDGKYYSDYTEEELFAAIEKNGGFAIAEYVEAEDVRDDVDTEWINVVVRKI